MIRQDLSGSRMAHQIHSKAAVGFGRAGADYERGRPGYPDEAVEAIGRALGLGPGRVVLELAAGTGKLTRSLTRFGARIITVEPVAGMREQLMARTPEVEVLEGSAERIPLDDASVNTVIVAQAFHWFDAAAAAAEIERVLTPGGGLGVVWNAWDESVPWVAELQALIHRHAGETPRQQTSGWAQVVQDSGRFTALTERVFANLVKSDLEALLARVASTSYIAALPRSERGLVLQSARALVGSDPLTRGRDEIETPYETHLVWCHRRGAPRRIPAVDNKPPGRGTKGPDGG